MLVPDDEICFSCVNANTADDVTAPDGDGRYPLPARLPRPSDRSARSPRATRFLARGRRTATTGRVAMAMGNGLSTAKRRSRNERDCKHRDGVGGHAEHGFDLHSAACATVHTLRSGYVGQPPDVSEFAGFSHQQPGPRPRDLRYNDP